MGRNVRCRRMGQRVSTVRAGTGGRSDATGTTNTIGVTCRGGHIGVTREGLVRGCARPEVRLGEEVMPSVGRRAVPGARGRHWALRHRPARTCLARVRRCCLSMVLVLLPLGVVVVLELLLLRLLVLI